MKEEIAERLALDFFVRCLSLPDGVTVLDEARKEANEILSKLAILDKDQSMPEIKHESYPTVGTQDARDHFEAGWNNGVNKAYRLGFRRIIQL